MKCPVCWAEKAYRRPTKSLAGALLSYLIVPMKCHHCHRTFHVPVVLAIGKQITPPPRPATANRPNVPSYAAQQGAAERGDVGPDRL